MKKILILLSLSVFPFSLQAIGQDPFSRLKIAAGQQPEVKKDMAKVSISQTDRRLVLNRRNAIPFKPFEMVDKNGKKIDSNEVINVNGKNEKAKKIFDRLNEIEREQNAHGYSLRSKKDAMVIDVVTPTSSLSGRIRELPTSVGALKSETELTNLSATTKSIGGLVLKPYELYNDAEKNKLKQTKFSVDASGHLNATTVPGNVNPSNIKGNNIRNRANTNASYNKLKNLTVDGSSHPAGATTPLKVIGEISNNEWSLGELSTFKAGLKVDLLRSAKIYAFNPSSPGKSMSEFKISAHAQVYGGLFGHSLDLLSGGMEFFAPADSSKKMTAKGQVLVGGITVLNLNESFTQSKTYSKSAGKSIDESFSISIPICCGIDFEGKIGVKGNVGLNYNGAIYRTIVNLSAEPVIDLKGYVEVGASIVDLVKIGMGGELTFLKGYVPLNGFVGIWAQNAEQVVAGYNYYIGYDLTMLSGRLYGFADVCVPFLGCSRLGEVNFFTWDGYKKSGTIVEGGGNYTLTNL